MIRSTYSRFLLTLTTTVSVAFVTAQAQAQVFNVSALAIGSPGNALGSSLAATSNTLVVGADYTNKKAGAVTVYTGVNGAWSAQTTLTAGDATAGDLYGKTVAISGETIVVGAPSRSKNTGGIYIYTNTKGKWSQQTSFAPLDARAGDAFGSSLSLVGNTLTVGAPGHNGTGAVYIFTVNQGRWSQEVEFTGSDSRKGDAFGSALASSNTTVAVGAPSSGTGGAAYLFTLTNGKWSQQTRLTSSAVVTGQAFGSSVSLLSNTLAVGAPSASTSTGKVYLFTSTNGTWQQTATVVASDARTGARFGATVLLTPNTLVVSAPNAGISRVYGFALEGESAVQVADVAGPTTGDYFGDAVSVVGETVFIGAPGTYANSGAVIEGILEGQSLVNANGKPADSYGSSLSLSGNSLAVGAPGINGSGEVLLYNYESGEWNQPLILDATDGKKGDDFGAVLALSGTTLVVGAPNHAGKGAVYIYTNTKGSWILQTEFVPANAKNGDAFGSSLALSGSNLLIGAPGTNKSTGAAYLYTLANGKWTLQTEFTGDNAKDLFGTAVAISGTSIAVGAPDAGKQVGGVYIYLFANGKWTQQTTIVPLDGKQGDQFGIAVGLLGNDLIVGSPLHQTTGAAYLYARTNAAWSQIDEQTPPDVLQGDHFGASLSLSATNLLISAPQQYIGTGTVYLFVATGGTWTGHGKFIAASGKSGDHFGAALAQSAGVFALGAPRTAHSTGTVYIAP